MQEMQVRSLGQEGTLEKKMATHSSILAWRIPRTAEPGGLQSKGSQSQTRLSTHIRYMMCKHFFPIIGCFILLMVFHSLCKSFLVWYSTLCLFLLSLPLPLKSDRKKKKQKKPMPRVMSRKLHLFFHLEVLWFLVLHSRLQCTDS